jgi:hypothetical protein
VTEDGASIIVDANIIFIKTFSHFNLLTDFLPHSNYISKLPFTICIVLSSSGL